MVLVEIVCVALANSVCRPPHSLDKVDCVRVEDILGLALQVLQFDIFGIGPGRQFDIEPRQVVVVALARDDQNISCLGPNGGLLADVGEIGPRDHVHHSPHCVAAITNHLVTKSFADDAVRTIAGLYLD